MTETTKEERDGFRLYAERTRDKEMQALVCDADRLAKLEDGIRALADELEGLGEIIEANRLHALLREDGD